MTDPSTLLGLTKEEAIAVIETNGDLWRILAEDGVAGLDDGEVIENRYGLIIDSRNKVSGVGVR